MLPFDLIDAIGLKQFLEPGPFLGSGDLLEHASAAVIFFQQVVPVIHAGMPFGRGWQQKKKKTLFSEIRALYPFREGNGKAQREFLCEFARCNYDAADFSKTTPDDMRTAGAESF